MADPRSRPPTVAAPPPLWSAERVSREHLRFAAPFPVEGPLRQCPAGTYEVETVEELIDGLSFPAYRVVSTALVLPVANGSARSCQMMPVDPAIVRAAREGAPDAGAI
ncbi:hypothetical protein AB7M35_003810 [Amorphus suaedae]